MAGSDLPALIVNVQRGGPGLGGIQPSQADYWQATKATGHGDFHILVLAPSTVQEIVTLTSDAFDMADKYRMPAMILIDGMLGQMMEPVEMPKASENKTEIEKPWAVTGHENGRKHNIVNSLYIEPEDLEALVQARFARYEEISATEQRAEEYLTEDADITIVAYGASARVSRSAVDMAREQGIKAGLIRPITLWPYPVDVIEKNVEKPRDFLCVEMSMGQMVDDVRLAVNGRKPVHFCGRTGGIIPTPVEVLEKIKEIAGGAK